MATRRERRVQLEVTNGVGVALLAAGALVAWGVRQGSFELAVGTVLVVVLILDAIVAYRAASRSQLELTPPAVIEAGTPSTWTVRRIASQRPVSIRLLLMNNQQCVLTVDERPGEVIVPSMWRGTVPFMVADLTARGPLGLIEAGRRVVLPFQPPIPVVPRPIAPRKPWPLLRARRFGLHEGAPVGDDTVRTIRHYTRGDERRRVHWKSTAHHGQLMVRESDGLGLVHVRIVVELGLAGSRADYVGGVAHGLINDALRRGWSVELVSLDASSNSPRLASTGYPFGPNPRLEPVSSPPPPTVAALVTGQRDLQWRLATMGYGTPQLADSQRGADLTCRVTPSGVHWS